MRCIAVLALLLAALPSAAEPEILGEMESHWLRQVGAAEAPARRSAAFALGKLGIDAGPRVLPSLVKLLDDPETGVRVNAARGIAEIARERGRGAALDWPRCGPALIQALNDPQPPVRWAALIALGSFGPRAQPAVEVIRKLLHDTEPSVRQNAAWALGAIGIVEGELVAELCERLRDDDPLVRRDSIVALAELHRVEANREHLREIGPALVRLMREEIGPEGKPRDAVVLSAVLEKWLEIRPTAPEHLARSLVPLLRGEEEELARLAAFVLASGGGPEADQALPILRRALRAADPTTQELAAASLGALGPLAEPAVLDLAAALRPDRAPAVRRNAAIALGRLGAKARPALNHLIESLRLDPKNPDEQTVRYYVVEAIAMLGYPNNAEALELLPDLIRQEKNSAVRVRAVWSFLGCEQLSPKAVEALTDLLREPAGSDTANARPEAARVLAAALREKAPLIVVEVLHEGLLAPASFRFDGTGTRVRAGNEQGQGSTVAEATSDPDGRYLYARGLALLGRRVRDYPQAARLKADLEAVRAEKNRPKLNDAAALAIKAIGF